MIDISTANRDELLAYAQEQWGKDYSRKSDAQIKARLAELTSASGGEAARAKDLTASESPGASSHREPKAPRPRRLEDEDMDEMILDSQFNLQEKKPLNGQAAVRADKKITVIVDQPHDTTQNAQTFSINGINYRVMFGEPVTIPVCLLEVMRHAVGDKIEDTKDPQVPWRTIRKVSKIRRFGVSIVDRG